MLLAQSGKTALTKAASEGHHKCLSILLAHGAAVDETTEVSAVTVIIICMNFAHSYKGSVLPLSLRQERQFNNGCLLISFYLMDCNPHDLFIDQDGFTALMIAVQEGHHECLSILLAHGADVNKATAVSVWRRLSMPVAFIGVAVKALRCNYRVLLCQL